MDDVAPIEPNLDEHRRRAAERVAALTRELDEIVESAQLANVDDEHDPDGSTIAYERAKVIALLATARHDLDALDAAIERSASSVYGICGTCGRSIAPERLEVLPATTTCVDCASA